MPTEAGRVRLNGTSNGTPAGPTAASLQAESAGIHRTVKGLAGERAGLALAALRGDTASATRIGEIDQERAALAARLETVESALRALHEEARAVEWKQFVPHARAIWRFELRQQWEAWPKRLERLLLGRQAHDVIALRDALAELEQVEANAARVASERGLPDHLARTSFVPGDAHDRGASYAKNRDERQRLVGLVVEALLADSHGLKRPAALAQAIVDARHRLEVEAAAGRISPQPHAGPRWGDDMTLIGKARG
jgi:hypothetical protein